jgi:quinol-cytochrome oxidoreductase complex cytochrome b subunit
MSAIAQWVQDRLPISPEVIRELTNEPVPNHMKRWWFALGGTPAYLFVVQIITGILLAFYYETSTGSAYESVRYITNEAAFGWYLRSVHKWAATLMIAAVVLHQMRVYFTGAYRKPREINWVVGMFLLLCTLMLGFTGYSLVFEQLSYWGATVGANMADSIPVLGPLAKNMMLAGDTYNSRTLSRFFVIHAAILPVALTGLIVLHIMVIRMQGITEFKFADEDDSKSESFNFFPDHMYTELMLGLVLMLLLSALATIFPASMGPRADPLTTPEVIKPEWFFYVVFRWLKLFPGTFAILSTGLVVFTMFAWPFIDAAIRARTRFKEASVWIGIIGVLSIIALTLWEALVAH